MTTVVQRNSGYPLMFCITPGNINDISTITRSINDLNVHDIDTDFAFMDDGYFTVDNVDALYDAGIDFITRLPKRNRTLYNTFGRASKAHQVGEFCTLQQQDRLHSLSGM